MHLAFNRLMFLRYQGSDFNNWEKWEILLYVFIILSGRFSFKLNFIPGWNSTRFIPGWNSRVNRNFFIPGWDFISVTCKRTLRRTQWKMRERSPLFRWHHTWISCNLSCRWYTNEDVTKNDLLKKFEKNSQEKVRTSPPKVFLGKGVLEICSKFTGEHLCRNVILIKLVKYIKSTIGRIHYRSCGDMYWKPAVLKRIFC